MNSSTASPQVWANDLSIHMIQIETDPMFRTYANPYMDQSIEFVKKFALDHEIMYWGFEEIIAMPSYLYPQADLERLTFLGQFFHLLFWLDDMIGDLPTSQGMVDEAPPSTVKNMIDACIRSFRCGEETPNDVMAQTFLNLRNQIMPFSDPAWFDRLTKNTVEYLNYTVEPASYGWRADGSVLAETFIPMREFISGMYPTIDLIEFATNHYLPADLMNHPSIQKLRRGCARICCLTNDIFSYEKEMLNGLPLNLIRVIELNQGLPMEKAAVEAIRIINQEIFEYKQAAENCRFWDENTNVVVREYIQGLNHQIGAAWSWETKTNRYRSTQSPFIELRTLL